MSDFLPPPVSIGPTSLTIEEPTTEGTPLQYERSFAYFDPSFPLKSRYSLLHRQLAQEPFFRDMLDAVTEEIQTTIEELTYPSAVAYTPRMFSTREKYESDLRNVLRVMNYRPDYYLAPYLFANPDMETEWKKWDAHGVHFSHRYRNSFYMYRFIFSRIWKHGGVFLEVYYPADSTTLNALQDKAIRLVDNGIVPSNFLPPEGEWPQVGFITGANSYDAFASLYRFRFDLSSRFFDEGTTYEGTLATLPAEPEEADYVSYPVEVDVPLRFDDSINPVVKDRTLVLSMTADRVMNLQENTLFTTPPDCLQDIPFLQYIERQARLNKRTVERVKVGTQLTIACDTSGYYIKSDASQYSMPFIHANITVLKSNWDENNEPHILRFGVGRLTGREFNSVFMRPGAYQQKAIYGQSSAYGDAVFYGGEQGEDPEILSSDGVLATFDMKRPVFSTVIGEYEKGAVSSTVFGVNAMVEKLDLQGNSTSFLLYSPEDPEHVGTEVATLPFSHEYLTHGTFEGILPLNTFFIRIGATLVDTAVESNPAVSLTRKSVPVEDFLFGSDLVTAPYNITNHILFNFSELRYFGSEKEISPLGETTVESNAAYLELKAYMLDEENPYQWIFSSLKNPEELLTLGELVLTFDGATVDCHQEVLDYLGVDVSDPDPENHATLLTLSYIQNWITETSAWVDFFPVQEYDIDGKAAPLDPATYLASSILNWQRDWVYSGWYRYVPQFLWRVYLDITEAVDVLQGWRPVVQYMIFNDLTFREALRFYENIVATDTVIVDDLAPRERVQILKDFFASLGESSVYANSPTVNDPEFDEAVESQQDFFTPTFTGSVNNIPLIILYNHMMVDMSYEYEYTDVNIDSESTMKSGVELDKEQGRLRFKTMFDSAAPSFVTPNAMLPSSTIDERTPYLNETASMYLRYVVNTTKNFADPLDLDSQIVGITEAGIYNTEDKLIAYAHFPPVIYDSYNNHLAMNWYISDIEFSYP